MFELCSLIGEKCAHCGVYKGKLYCGVAGKKILDLEKCGKFIKKERRRKI